MNKNILTIGALNTTRSTSKFWYNNKPFFGLDDAMVSDIVTISHTDSNRLRSVFSLDNDYNNDHGSYSRAQSDQKSTLDDQRKSANILLKINSIDQVTSEVIVSGNKKSGFQKQIIFYNNDHIIFSLMSDTTNQQWDSSDYVISGSNYMVLQVLKILSTTSDMAFKAMNNLDPVDRSHRIHLSTDSQGRHVFVSMYSRDITSGDYVETTYPMIYQLIKKDQFGRKCYNYEAGIMAGIYSEDNWAILTDTKAVPDHAWDSLYNSLTN